MRISRSRPLARTVVALASASLFLAACGGGDSGNDEPAAEGDATGVTDTTIKIGDHKPLTGVAAPGYSEIPSGMKAYFDYVNAQGGVNGRTIEYTTRDDGYNPSNTSQVTNQLVLQDEIFAMVGGLGTPTHSAVLDFLNEEEVPDLFVASGSLTWNQPDKYPYTFGWQLDYAAEGKIIGKYIKENFPQAKVGLFLQGDDFGRDGAAGAKLYIEDQVVSEVTYTPGNTDVAPQITKLQADGADFVLGFNVPSYTALSQLTALKLNFKPTWFYSNVGADPTLVGNLLANFSKGAVSGGGLLENSYSTKYMPLVENADNPWTKLWQKVWEANGEAGKPLTNFRVYGMAQAYTTVAAIQAAGKDLTRQGLVEALEESGSEFKGPWFAPLDYSEDSHRGVSGGQVTQLVGGKIEEKTPVLTVGVGAEEADAEEFDGEASEPSESGLPDNG